MNITITDFENSNGNWYIIYVNGKVLKNGLNEAILFYDFEVSEEIQKILKKGEERK